MRRWLVDYPRAVPIAVFGLIAAITVLSVVAIELGERQRRIAQLSEKAMTIASAIERRGDAASAYLQAGAALFETQGEVSRATFGAFVESLRLDRDYLGAEGFGWARVVKPFEVYNFEEEMRATAVADYKVTPPPALASRQVVPVTYLYPVTERNLRALGYDMYSEPSRRMAMDEAEQSLRPTATGRVVLIQEQQDDQPGFLIYMPVYRKTDTGRRLDGFIYSPFNANAFLASAVKLPAGYEHRIRLYDGVEPKWDNLIGEMGGEAGSDLLVTQQLNFANRPMVLEMEAAKDGTISRLAMLTLIFGMLVASLLLVVLRLLTRQVLEDQAALDWLEEQDSIRDSLTRELNHRVKNTLANVLSIVALTRRRATSLDQFADGLDGRVRAMSATHDLLTRSEWGTTPMRDVIEAEMAFYLADEERHIDISGPTVQLAPGDALSFGLAVHELTTNAARHGALSTPGGVVSIHWDVVRPDLVRVVWQETGGPDARPAGQHGFGLQLIERIVAHELGQPVEIEFGENGVTCVLLVPVRTPSDFALRARYRK